MNCSRKEAEGSTMCRARKQRRVSLALMILVSLVIGGAAQARLNEAEVRASYLFNLTKFIKWPDETTIAGSLSICVLGENPFGELLEQGTAGKKMEGRDIAVRTYKNADSDGWQSCNLLYIATSESQQVARILAGVSEQTVTISDIPEFAYDGGMIGFVGIGTKVRMMINEDVLKSSGLKVSAQVMKLMIVLEG